MHQSFVSADSGEMAGLINWLITFWKPPQWRVSAGISIYLFQLCLSAANVCCLLQTFSNQIWPDKTLGLIWIQNVLHFWEKANFEKR